MPVITLLSDFGSLYPAVMKGVVLDICPGCSIIDINHDISPQDIRSGAFILYTAAKYFPSGTVHVAVVDPGVGTKRRPVAIRARYSANKYQFFVGPDNGLLIPAARRAGQEHFEVYEICNEQILLKEISSTFHGRDIFAPAGAHLACGIAIEEMGCRIDDYVNLDFGGPEVCEDGVKGNIIYIDDFGNIITNIEEKTILKIIQYGDYIRIFDETIPFLRTYGQIPAGAALALIGSHGFLEIAVNQGNAKKRFNVESGEEIFLNGIR